jgi:hypothetical protein
MKSHTVILILLFVILLFVILFINYYDRHHVKQFSNFKSSCGEYSELLQKVMVNRDMKEVTNNDYDVYIPCSYNDCEKEVLLFEGLNGKKIFLIDGCDLIASKMALWELLKEYYKEKASDYMPESYLLEKPEEIVRLKKNFKTDKIYFLKNYAQRQEGLKLTKNLADMVDGLKDGWYLAQEYKYNPYIIDRRKINFRYYMLVVCSNGKTEAYIHSDGFLYYTPEYYDPQDGVPTKYLTVGKHITTGYIDRKVYEHNPLTLEDFREHLDKKGCGLREKWNNSVQTLMNKVMEAISKKICKNTKLDCNVRFQLFGCDVAPDANLGASLMEINKGPDLGAKDGRDREVKLKVQHDIFKLIDPKDEYESLDTRFVKIFESKKSIFSYILDWVDGRMSQKYRLCIS